VDGGRTTLATPASRCCFDATAPQKPLQRFSGCDFLKTSLLYDATIVFVFRAGEEYRSSESFILLIFFKRSRIGKIGEQEKKNKFGCQISIGATVFLG
jgi:hypothetical protein